MSCCQSRAPTTTSPTLSPGRAAPAGAGCTEPTDANTVKRSLSQRLSCNDRRLRSGPTATCRSTPSPACAGTLVADAAALGYGPNDDPSSGVDLRALADQLRCQKKIGRGITSYVGIKLRAVPGPGRHGERGR